MNRLGMRLPAALVLVVAASSAAGCTLMLLRDLGREGAIERGSVSGRLVRADTDEPAPFAQVALPGSGRGGRSNGEGNFVIRGMVPGTWALRLADDVDGDGWAERAALKPFRVAFEPHASSPADLVVGSGEADTTGIALGDIELELTGVIDGTVTLQGGDFPDTAVGRVAVLRESLGDGETLTLALGAEAITHVDDDGRFYLAGLRPGAAKLVALAYDVDDDSGELGDVLGMSAPVVVEIAGDVALTDPINIGAIDIDSDLLAPLDDTLPVGIGLGGEVGTNVYFMFAPPGRAFPTCEASPADYTGSEFDYIVQTDLRSVSDAFINVDVPMGLVDVQACSAELGGVLRGQLADTDFPLWGPIAIGAEIGRCETHVRIPETTCTDNAGCRESADGTELCKNTGEREGAFGAPVFACYEVILGDCDGDTVSGLPLLTPETAYVWDECGLPGIVNGVRVTTRCGGLLGEQLGGATCTVRTGDYAGDYDCDDDGDGQADADEPLCYGEGLGTDLDRDGYCSGQDPYPLCRANNPVECDAEVNDFDEPDPGPDVEPPFDGGGMDDRDSGSEVEIDSGSMPAPMYGLELDDTWADGGALDLDTLGPMGQLAFARVVNAGGRSFVFAVSAGLPQTLVWSVDVEGAAQGGDVWGGLSPAFGAGYDLVVDPNAMPEPKVALAFSTADDILGDNQGVLGSWGWLELATLNPDLSLTSDTLVDPEVYTPQYFDPVDGGPDAGIDLTFNSALGDTSAAGVSQSIDGKFWLTGGTLEGTAGSVYLYGRDFIGGVSSYASWPLPDQSTLPVTRWPAQVDLDGNTYPDILVVPASASDGSSYLASFEVGFGTGIGEVFTSSQQTSGDLFLDGYTDSAFRTLDDGTHEIVLVGRSDSMNVFMELVTVDTGRPELLVRGNRFALPGPPSEALAEPRVAVIDDDHAVVVVMGGTSAGIGTFTLGNSLLMVVDRQGSVHTTAAPSELAEPSDGPSDGQFVDVHPSPDGSGFLVARFDPGSEQRSLIKVRAVLGGSGGTGGGDADADSGTGGLVDFDAGAQPPPPDGG
jgi:hypothetical protein